MKTSELIGAQLDQAVAKACGLRSEVFQEPRGVVTCFLYCQTTPYSPSTDPAQAWLIIERERIELGKSIADSDWYARPKGFDRTNVYYGPTSLIAAMRAFVASKLGEEVEI